MKTKQTLKQAAVALLPQMRAWRRDFHQHPELSGHETRTAAKVATILRGMGLRVQTGIGGTGVVGLLAGRRAGPVIALRADMDALPLTEINNVPYRSRTPGVMHACGHDGHTAMLLGAATLLRKDPPDAGAVKFIFQPAEETVAGAPAMITDGVMRAPKVDAIFALHIKSDLKFGAIALRDGPGMAAGRHFHIRVTGRGGHGARPDLASDPLPPAHAIYAAIQTIRRNLPPTSPCVISICAFNAGQAPNIIPAFVDLRGTLRTYKPPVERQACQAIRTLAQNTARAFGARAAVEFSTGTPAVDNAATPAALLRHAASALGMPVREIEPLMVSEDFSFFQKQAPGVLAWLGTLRGRRARDLHTPDFDFDEAILAHGAALLATVAKASSVKIQPHELFK